MVMECVDGFRELVMGRAMSNLDSTFKINPGLSLNILLPLCRVFHIKL